MKRTLSLILIAVIFLGTLSACKKQEKGNIFTSDNEILTYQKLDPEKTQIVVARTGNISAEGFCKAFEEQNPDIQVIFVDITGGNTDYNPLKDWITQGYAPDVLMSADGFFDTEMTVRYFNNLSDNPIIKNYEAAALQRTAIDSNVYWLPGPSDINAMLYNKTLFDEYGWQIPTSFDEFIALCDKIREDTDGEVEAWNPNAKYSNELLIAMEAFTYEELFGGSENRLWYNDFTAGKASFGEHMKPYLEVIQTLIDHDILREEHFSYSATTRGKEFADGKIAMINITINQTENDKYDFSVMPFPTTKGELGYLCDKYSCYVGLPKKEHTQEQNDAINRFIEYFSSEAGQKAYIGNGMKISNIKGVSINNTDMLAELQSAVDAGNMFALLDFMQTNGNTQNYDLYGYAAGMANGTLTIEDCIAQTENPDNSNQPPQQNPPSATVATVTEDMTVLETSFLFADAYRKAADADIGLITANEAYRGNLMRMFTGDISEKMLTVFKPRSFANDSAFIKVSMTGKQLMDALNNPVGNSETANCIYAYSGLKCVVAPWNGLGSKYLSVKLEDGSDLVPEKQYSVAIWAGTVKDEYITQTLETYEGTWEDIMAEQLLALGSVAPADDNRITLVWD